MATQCSPKSAPAIPQTPGLTPSDLEFAYSQTDEDIRTNTVQQKIDYIASQITTTQISEGANKYLTDDRVNALIALQKAEAGGLATLTGDKRLTHAQIAPWHVEEWTSIHGIVHANQLNTLVIWRNAESNLEVDVPTQATTSLLVGSEFAIYNDSPNPAVKVFLSTEFGSDDIILGDKDVKQGCVANVILVAKDNDNINTWLITQRYLLKSVNGQTGDVELTADDIPQGVTNKYMDLDAVAELIEELAVLSVNGQTGIVALNTDSITEEVGANNRYMNNAVIEALAAGVVDRGGTNGTAPLTGGKLPVQYLPETYKVITAHLRGEDLSGDWVIAMNMPYAGTIVSTTTKSYSGSATGTFKINSTALGGGDNAISAAINIQPHSTNNTFASGAHIILSIHDVFTLKDVYVSINVLAV